MIIRNFGIDLHLYMKRYRQREITDNNECSWICHIFYMG